MTIKEFHTEYGRHSNIPECCIDFWNNEFDNLFYSNMREAYEELQNDTEKRIRRKFRYRPCFNCLKTGHWQKIHNCSKKLWCHNLYRNLLLEIKHEEKTN